MRAKACARWNGRCSASFRAMWPYEIATCDSTDSTFSTSFIAASRKKANRDSPFVSVARRMILPCDAGTLKVGTSSDSSHIRSLPTFTAPDLPRNPVSPSQRRASIFSISSSLTMEPLANSYSMFNLFIFNTKLRKKQIVCGGWTARLLFFVIWCIMKRGCY